MNVTLDQRIELAERRVDKCFAKYAMSLIDNRPLKDVERAERRKEIAVARLNKLLRRAREEMTG